MPFGKTDKARVEAIVKTPDRKRTENLALLKKVDEADNPVEWIVSVNKLTEAGT